MAMVLRHVVLLSLIRWVFVGAAGRDTHSGVHEADWFIPADHVQEIQQFISSWAGSCAAWKYLFGLFGFATKKPQIRKHVQL